MQCHAMFVWEKLKHFAVTLLISIRTNWIQRSTQKNAGCGERRAELRRTARGLQFIIKVNSLWFYNQQEEVINQKLLRVIDRFVFNNLAVDNAGQQADTRQAHRQHYFSFLSSSEQNRQALGRWHFSKPVSKTHLLTGLFLHTVL